MKIGRNESCPCGSGKKYKKCCGSISHISRDLRNDREKETFGSFGRRPMYDSLAKPMANNPQVLLRKIRAQKKANQRVLPSSRLVSIGNSPPENDRRFLVDACSKLADENWCGRTEMCIYFAVLVRHGLMSLGYCSNVETGKARYSGNGQEFEWDHAWVHTSNGDVIDANIDTMSENPFVPSGIDPSPYWGPRSQLPSDRSFEKEAILSPERDTVELDADKIVQWKNRLERMIKDYSSKIEKP